MAESIGLPVFDLALARQGAQAKPSVVGNVTGQIEHSVGSSPRQHHRKPVYHETGSLASLNGLEIVESIRCVFPDQAERNGLAVVTAVELLKECRLLAPIVGTTLSWTAEYNVGNYTNDGDWHVDGTFFSAIIAFEGGAASYAMYGDRGVEPSEAVKRSAYRPSIGEVVLITGGSFHCAQVPDDTHYRSSLVLFAGYAHET